MSNRSEIVDDFEDEASINSDDDDDSSLEDGVKPPPPPAELAQENSDADDDFADDDDDDVDSLTDSVPDDYQSSSKEVGLAQNTSIMDSDFIPNDEDDEDYDEDDDHYLQKFDSSLKTNIVSEYHPELKVHNNEEVEALSRVVRNEHGIIIDPLHKTVPFLTKYERARVLGERAKQLNMGAKPLVEVADTVIDGYLIALEEFAQKRIPFIIKRPLPNGGCEYWKFRDLEII